MPLSKTSIDPEDAVRSRRTFWHYERNHQPRRKKRPEGTKRRRSIREKLVGINHTELFPCGRASIRILEFLAAQGCETRANPRRDPDGAEHTASLRESLSWFSLPWMGSSQLVTNWLAANLALGGHLRPWLFVVTSAIIFFLFVVMLVRMTCARPIWTPFWQGWKVAGTAERVGGLLASSWPVAIVVFSPFLVKRVFPALGYSLVIPVLLLLVLGWRFAFHAGEALWTRSVTAKHLRTLKQAS